MFRKIPNDGNGPAAANKNGLFTKYIAKGLGGYVDGGVIRIHYDGGARTEHAHFGLDSGGGVFGDEFFIGGDDFFRVLVGDHAHADLGGGAGGNHGLGAGSG